ncbi:pantothenate kinase [Pseudomonas sp. NA-150]|uniref:pantothenate kinase n=1 Tax=Pseudomonas sp. NA-150 TaxID=3367525 RepID=UPI0037C94735
MILELDCGNSFIKWRVIRAEGIEVVAGGVVDSDAALVLALQQVVGLTLVHCRLVSVRSSDETELLISSLTQAFSMKVQCAGSERSLAGVVNGYDDYQRLGLDRWLAFVGAYHLARKACLVIDLGTAITSDFVSRDGEHIGGFICPGMPLMRNLLRTHTRRIRYHEAAAQEALKNLSPGRSTAEAVERGCSLMVRGFVQSQLEVAQEHWGDDFSIFVTGGDAALVSETLPGARVMPDLVFVGLALACPLS